MNPVGEATVTKVINEVKNFVETIFQELNNRITKMSLDELVEIYSEKIDEVILKEEVTRNLKYVGGKFTVNYLRDSAFVLTSELYFQDHDKQWVKVQSKSSELDTKYLVPAAMEELKKKKSVSYDVEEPKQKKDAGKEREANSEKPALPAASDEKNEANP